MRWLFKSTKSSIPNVCSINKIQQCMNSPVKFPNSGCTLTCRNMFQFFVKTQVVISWHLMLNVAADSLHQPCIIKEPSKLKSIRCLFSFCWNMGLILCVICNFLSWKMFFTRRYKNGLYLFLTFKKSRKAAKRNSKEHRMFYIFSVPLIISYKMNG